MILLNNKLLRILAIVMATGSTLLPGHSAAQILSIAASGEETARSTEIDRLFVLLASAPDEQQAQAIENEIWKKWTKHPDPKVQGLVKEAMEARRWYDFEKARKLLNQVVELAPDYAEGWNQRAFILFLQEKFDQSLSDLERALELEPRHFGAMAGQARILMRQGRFATGQSILKKAVKIHPFLRERSMIVQTQEQDL